MGTNRLKTPRGRGSPNSPVCAKRVPHGCVEAPIVAMSATVPAPLRKPLFRFMRLSGSCVLLSAGVCPTPDVAVSVLVRTLHAEPWRTAASPKTNVAVSSEPPNRFPAALHHCHRRGPLVCRLQAFCCIRIRSETADTFVSLIRRCARLVMFCRRGPHQSLDE